MTGVEVEETMTENHIKNLEGLIQKYTGISKRVVISVVKSLTAPGDNYWGIILKVEAILKNEENEEENFNAVAKCFNFNLPEIIRKLPAVHYKKENAFYTEIIPTLQNFINETKVDLNYMDIFPKLYASRSSLDENNDVVDENAVLLFEDLCDQGFRHFDRIVGFDVEVAKVLLKDLAVFHAVPLVLKLKHPEIFENKIKKHLYKVYGGCYQNRCEDVWQEILVEHDEIKRYLKQLTSRLKKNHDESIESNEIFSTILHMDLWTNNTMQRVVRGRVVKNKIIDLQLYGYGSVVNDIMFFLWSSVQLPLIRKEFDNLVKYYHDTFINILDQFGCDIKPFNYDNFLNELSRTAQRTLNILLCSFLPIFSKRGEAAFDINECPLKLTKEFFSTEARARANQLVIDFAQRGWL